jgi:RNA polymerase sigma-70 factor (ECF subfamily)
MGTERQGLMNFAYRLLASRADAEDAVQDTYLRAMSVFSDSAAAQPAWLYTVLRNIAIDRLPRQQFEAGNVTEEVASHGSTEAPIEVGSECEAALRHLLRAVSPAEAAAILLRDVFEFDYDEIARILGKSEAAARQFLHRARTRTHRSDQPVDLEDSYGVIYWRAIESRDPASLIRMLRPTTVSTQPTATILGLLHSEPKAARGSSMLVQVNGRYAMAWMLDGVILCIGPVGPEATMEHHYCS